MKKLIIASILALASTVVFAGSFSTGAIDTVARANAATAQSTANSAISKLDGGIASTNINVDGGTLDNVSIGSVTPNTGAFTTLNGAASAGNSVLFGGRIVYTNTVPTILSNCGTGATIGGSPIAFEIVIGTSPPTSACNIAMPAATYRWMCAVGESTFTANTHINVYNSNNVNVLITKYLVTTAAITPFTAGEVLRVVCNAG